MESDFFPGFDNGGQSSPEPPLELTVTFDVSAGGIRFKWLRAGTGNDETVVAGGRLAPSELIQVGGEALEWIEEGEDGRRRDGCNTWPASVRALVNRIRKRHMVAGDKVRIGLLRDGGESQAASNWEAIELPPGADVWEWLVYEIRQFAQALESRLARGGDAIENGRTMLRLLGRARPGGPEASANMPEDDQSTGWLDLCVTFNQIKRQAEFLWRHPKNKTVVATGRVRCTGTDQLTWDLEREGGREPDISSHHRNSVRAALNRWLKLLPVNRASFSVLWIQPQPGTDEPLCEAEPPFGRDESPFDWLEDNLVAMAQTLRFQFTPAGRMIKEMDATALAEFERYGRKQLRKEQKRAEEEARRHETMARLAEERRRREQRKTQARGTADKSAATPVRLKPQIPSEPSDRVAVVRDRPVLPPVPVRFEMPPLVFQETAFPLADLRSYALRERAAVWWVSNQSDDLLCLPHCRIEHLEYQLRTALRVLGPLRGRALLSDEVGLGKTIEAGLIIKELLTRGMVKRFLVLTVPSLVDQWAEELNEKFGLATVTTNQIEARGDPEQFWRGNGGIVASLHTLKQPAQLAVARQVHWDILVVDEAHYLRNRQSQAWQAVNALPRQHLLLLTATPVQNSLDDLYNLVTLLQPGQLPAPKEFRARFVDPKRPRQPREPEELRRLLGQVMIRNTRANAGVHLPSRRAETVLFNPDQAERAFWQSWETEFRGSLARLGPGQASLWGRLVLQAAGSSPAAWRAALEKFPDSQQARTWRQQAPLENSWRRKCELVAPLTRGEGGAVVFTQFLETQSALANYLRGAGVETFVVNGGTPPPERQPITEAFRKLGGALLLTHSGTEGRNLQFCHRLANFDLPWNPMEIEQRIGRLHRLGQQRPVQIYNLVQAGTLQEHLLRILQEKLNLFELVVGETGLVLGEQFGSDEFADEVLRRWRASDGRVAEAMAGLGDELAAARDQYAEVKELDETLFAKDYESA